MRTIRNLGYASEKSPVTRILNGFLKMLSLIQTTYFIYKDNPSIDVDH